MGVWGVGNFDNDPARDYLANIITLWEQDIERILAGDVPDVAKICSFAPGFESGLYCLLPTVEIMIAVASKLECDYLPSENTVRRWSEQLLRWYDAAIDSWTSDTTVKIERRRVIVATFDRLLSLIHCHQARETDSPSGK